MWDDPKALNAFAATLASIAVALLAIGAVVWAARNDAFALREVVVATPLARSSPANLEAAIRSDLSGTFFTLDLDTARAALVRVPWVRNVSLRRQWPGRLEIAVEEHVPYARWGDSGLVNAQGEIFAATHDGELPQFDGRAARGKTVVLHLGNGASMCALQAGASVASTMGFTALDGLPMGTRCGAIDPGVLLYLMDACRMDARAIETLLYHQSGLLGVSGISSDMRTLLASSEPRARLAIDLYCYRIRRELGSLAAALGGLDAVVFTGGIGENAVAIRERVCRDAAWLGVELDPAANAASGPRLSTPGARASAWAIPTNEELMIARHTRRLLS